MAIARAFAWVAWAFPILLCGCAAPQPIHKIDASELPAKGVAFSLPRTRVTPSFVVTSIRFVEGPYTSELECCEDSKADDEGGPITYACAKDPEFEAIMSSACPRMLDLALESKRLSRNSGFKTTACPVPKAADGTVLSDEPADGTDFERRQKIDRKDIKLAFEPTADPDATYWMPIKGSLLSKYKNDISLSAAGVVTSGFSKTTNEAAQMALDFSASLIRPRVPGLPTDRALAVESEDEPDPGLPSDLVQLEKLLGARRALLARAEPGSAVLVDALDREIAGLRARFEGALASDQKTVTAKAYIPTSKCVEQRLLAYSACGDIVTQPGATPASLPTFAARAVKSVWVGATPTEGWTQLKAKYDKSNVAEKVGDKASWPYRIPAEVAWWSQENADMSTNCPALTSAVPAAATFHSFGALPQLGIVARLPIAAGGRSSEISAKYHGDTGGLAQVIVDSEAASAAAVAKEVTARVTRDDDRAEFDQYRADVAAMAEICAKEALLNLPRSEFCKAP